MVWKRVGIAVLLTTLSLPLAAQQDSQSIIAAIKAEGMRSLEARIIFHTLTDVIGPRLTGSPAHVEAARWAAERLKACGLDNSRLEPFRFGRGWSLEKLTVEMIAPRYMPLIGYAEAWSPTTSGVLTGTPIYIGDSTAADIDCLGPRLRGVAPTAISKMDTRISEFSFGRTIGCPVAVVRADMTGVTLTRAASWAETQQTPESTNATRKPGTLNAFMAASNLRCSI